MKNGGWNPNNAIDRFQQLALTQERNQCIDFVLLKEISYAKRF